jgi:hypothetical protein
MKTYSLLGLTLLKKRLTEKKVLYDSIESCLSPFLKDTPFEFYDWGGGQHFASCNDIPELKGMLFGAICQISGSISKNGYLHARLAAFGGKANPKSILPRFLAALEEVKKSELLRVDQKQFHLLFQFQISQLGDILRGGTT